MLNAKAEEALNIWVTAASGFAGVLEGTSNNWEVAREHYMNEMARAFPAPDDVVVSPVEMGGIPGALLTPDEVEVGRTLLYIHGGGYAVGGSRGYHNLAGRYAKQLRARVYVPDYRLAPQHQFPASIDDAFTAYRSLIDQGQDPSKLVLSGDSAGGAMVITLMRWARDAGLPLPAAGVAISPWANLSHTGDSCATREGLDPLNTVYFLNRLARTFLGTALPTDPDASPVFADVRGLSPILLQIGENELMLSDAVRLAGHLGENRVRTSLEIWPGMFHVWQLCAGFLPEADRALESAVGFLQGEMSVGRDGVARAKSQA